MRNLSFKYWIVIVGFIACFSGIMLLIYHNADGETYSDKVGSTAAEKGLSTASDDTNVRKIDSEDSAKQQIVQLVQKMKKTAEAATIKNIGENAATDTVVDIAPIRQYPELPRGCEVTSLAMLIQAAGGDVDKMELAEKIEKVPYFEEGYYGNPHNGFVGNMYTLSAKGYSAYHEPVFRLARNYIDAVDITGSTWADVERQLTDGKPVWVIVTSYFRYIPEKQWQSWHTSSGTIKMTFHEHSVLVTGFSEGHVFVNDPLDGAKNKKLDKEAFVSGWEQFGRQAITY